jgi:hypothetical protein
MTNISRLEKENIAMREKATDCPELGSDLAETRAIANDLRRAANALALVGLVTRLNHWVSIFVEEITNKTAKNRGLVTNLKRLNDQTGSGKGRYRSNTRTQLQETLSLRKHIFRRQWKTQ